MIYHFIKYGWIVLLKDKTTKNILGASKMYYNHNVPTTLQTDNGTEFENSIMNQFNLR